MHKNIDYSNLLYFILFCRILIYQIFFEHGFKAVIKISEKFICTNYNLCNLVGLTIHNLYK